MWRCESTWNGLSRGRSRVGTGREDPDSHDSEEVAQAMLILSQGCLDLHGAVVGVSPDRLGLIRPAQGSEIRLAPAEYALQPIQLAEQLTPPLLPSGIGEFSGKNGLPRVGNSASRAATGVVHHPGARQEGSARRLAVIALKSGRRSIDCD
jgi:hypothetical protein